LIGQFLVAPDLSRLLSFAMRMVAFIAIAVSLNLMVGAADTLIRIHGVLFTVIRAALIVAS
jgi:hypothetical protein